MTLLGFGRVRVEGELELLVCKGTVWKGGLALVFLILIAKE